MILLDVCFPIALFVWLPLLHLVFILARSFLIKVDKLSAAIDIQSSLKCAELASRGLLFYGLLSSVEGVFSRQIDDRFKELRNRVKSGVWNTFLVLCVCSCVLFCLYIVVDFESEYLASVLSSVEEHEVLLILCSILYIFTLLGYYKVRDFRNIVKSNYDNLRNVFCFDQDEGSIEIEENREVFLAFHGVCYHEAGENVLDDLTFSVLPGELIVVIGDRSKNCRHLFDLLTKFSRSQSGNIYLAGINIEHVKKSSIRKLFSIFQLDFGLIPGTIEDNLKLLSDQNENKLQRISEKVGISEFFQEEVIGSDGNICTSQENLIRLQMARVFIRSSKVILISEPEKFETAHNKELFYDFVKFISTRKTVIIETRNLSLIVYSNKILYLGEAKQVFGSHAELIENSSYRNYLQKISEKTL